MNIHGNDIGPDRSQRSFEERQRALIDANRALVRAARADLAAVAQARTERRDQVELSEAALAAHEPSTSEREARVRELAEAHRMERLHTPERLERAAQRLLEG